jgi:hypothetical protein
LRGLHAAFKISGDNLRRPGRRASDESHLERHRRGRKRRHRGGRRQPLLPGRRGEAEYLLPSNTKTMCSWKGQASYHTLFVNGDANPDAVWFYPDPKEAAAEIKGRVAFWKGVRPAPAHVRWTH